MALVCLYEKDYAAEFYVNRSLRSGLFCLQGVLYWPIALAIFLVTKHNFSNSNLIKIIQKNIKTASVV
jgi:hypothetical protein